MNISIIGGGIAGLTTAVALTQLGYTPHVYEAANELKPLGAGIILSPNAMAVLRHLGLEQEALAQGQPIKALQLAQSNNERIMQSTAMQLGNLSSVGIHRGALQNLLLSALPAEQLHLSHRLKQVTQDQAGVTATFGNREQLTSDILLGADGLRSAVRQTIFPENKTRDSGQICWRGVAQIPAGQTEAIEYWGIGTRFGVVPISEREIYWYATDVTEPEGVFEAKYHKIYLQNRFSSYPKLVRNLLQATPVEKLLRHPLIDIEPLPEWYKNRIALVGDAAHAMTPNLGQGAAQSMVSAWTIAQCFAQFPDNRAQAFNHFQQLRLKPVQQVIQQCWQIGQLTNWTTPWLCQTRNNLISLVPTWVGNIGRRRTFALPKIAPPPPQDRRSLF